MSFFNSDIPIFSRKKSAFDIQDLPGLWRVHWQVGRYTILSTFYTRHDQACLLWGFLSTLIFAAVQFLPISWLTQALYLTTLTGVGIIAMLGLTLYLSSEKQFAQVLVCWFLLMFVGIVVTDLSVFLGWGYVLGSICPLWLVLSGIGYFLTGIVLRSRMFLILCLIHIVGLWLLSYVGIWQPLTTGLIIGFCVFLVAELQWDTKGVCVQQLRPNLAV